MLALSQRRVLPLSLPVTGIGKISAIFSADSSVYYWLYFLLNLCVGVSRHFLFMLGMFEISMFLFDTDVYFRRKYLQLSTYYKYCIEL